MDRRKIGWVLISAGFLVLATAVTAQTMPSTSSMGQARPRGESHAAVEQNPACQRIIAECKKLGFIQGQYRQDNGLWKDCFDPVVKGAGSPTRDGKPISVPVSSSDVQACRAVASRHR